jgi:hypothetical protein
MPDDLMIRSCETASAKCVCVSSTAFLLTITPAAG